MANAETYRGDGSFFPLQGPRVQRGHDVRIPTDAANVEYPPISKRLTQADEDAVWAQYEAMPPSTDAMEKASNVHGSRRWMVPAIVGAALAIGIGYAALSERPAAIDEPALATNAQTADTSATALMGSAPATGDPMVTPQMVTPQSTFNSSQSSTMSPPPSSAAPAASAVEPAARAAPAPRAARVAPTAPVAEPATPAPTYSRGEAPATILPAPTPVPDSGTLTAPNPLPSAPAEEPALNMDLAPPSETVPAPGSVPENAQTPQ